MSSEISNFLDQALHSRLIVESAEKWAVSNKIPAAAKGAIPRSETLILALEGTAKINYEGQIFVIREGDMFLHPSWGLRKIIFHRNVRFRNAYINFSTPPEMDMLTPLLQVRCRDFEMEKREVARMDDLFRNRPPLWKLQAEACLKDMLGRMAGTFAETGGITRRSSHPSGTHAAEKVLNWIRSHYREQMNLDEAHRHGPISPRYFRQICKERTGLSPQHLVQFLRLRAARFYLLEHKELTIAEISSKVGFKDPLYFSKVYRSHWGRPPTADRSSYSTI